ncbi:MAG: ABC transporter ATP-binding protein [Thalassobaculales bacterium]
MIPLLDIEGLSVSFGTLHGRVRVLEGVSFQVGAGESVGLVGESGSGKSVTALAVLRLLGEQGRIDAGAIRLEGEDLAALKPAEMLAVRGRRAAMIFQEPMTSLNPVLPVGFQIAEVLEQHLGLGRAAARARAVALLRQVGVPAAERRADDPPHRLSGGMRQRVMIAIAIACRPKLLIADEPTTALDVTIQAQILELIAALQAETGMSVLMITHDLGVIAETCARVVVMYAGEVVEEAPVEALFADPRHPYTRALLRSIPSVAVKRERLAAIPGAAPSPAAFPGGCRFHPRCPEALARCRTEPPPLVEMAGRRARCWLAA